MKVLDSGKDARDYSLSQFLPNGIDTNIDEYILPLPDKSIVLNQYTTPTCVGQACAMAKMITEYILTNKWIGLSPYSIYGYYDNSGGGMSIRYGVELLHKWGCLPLSEFSCIGDNPELHREFVKHCKANPDCDISASRYKIDSYAKIKNFDEAKQAIAAGMPVVGVVETQHNFGRVNNGIEPKYPRNTTGRHAICFVGWKKIDETEYLIAINSWGENNGDKGKVYIPRGRKITDMFAISDTITPIKRKYKTLQLKIDDLILYTDNKVTIMDTAPFIENSRTYLPVRFIAKNLGAAVEWKSTEQKAIITSEEAIIEITVGSRIIKINGNNVKMDVVPIIRNDRILIPIRYIAEALNCSVKWIEASNEIIIISL